MSDPIDWAKVDQLRDEVGAEDFDEVVELFLEEVDEVIGQLGQPGRSLEHDLHFLKGSALNLGFATFSSICQSGEAACAAGNPDSVDVPAVLACYATSKTTFLVQLSARNAA